VPQAQRATTPLPQEQHDAIVSFACERAATAPDPLPCHWIAGASEYEGKDAFPYDAATDFCRDCAEAVIELFYEQHPEQHPELDEFDDDGKPDEDARVLWLDGGWRTEHDNPPYCEECGARLAASLTRHGVDQELEHFLDLYPLGWGTPNEWADFANAIDDLPLDDVRWPRIAEIVAQAQREGAELAVREQARRTEPGMLDARAALLGLFVARAEQRKHTPSFRLWADLAAWVELDRAEREDGSLRHRALGRRLRREAEHFLSHFEGIHYAGGHIARAPYGNYWWPLIVEAEQFRLWQHPAFLEGQGARGREAPYLDGSENARAWKAGRMLARSGA